MSEQDELLLRRSLDEIDRNRKWQIVAIIVVLAVFLLRLFGFVMWFYRFGSTTPATRELEVILTTNLQFMVFTVVFCTLGVCVYVSRMAKKTIKAIELLARSQGPSQG
jgi:hypothetical protein